ncbi:MAG: DUF3082 domain-containing protein [Prochloraceae cyanobacterium]
MSNSNSKQKSETSSTQTETKKVTPWSCLVGAVISGSLGSALYFLTSAIAQTFATKPIQSSNPFIINISSAVRTLVVGVAALGTGIFGVVTVGLVALAIQLLFQSLSKRLRNN